MYWSVKIHPIHNHGKSLRNVDVWWHWHLIRHVGTGHLLLLAALWFWPPGCRWPFCLMSKSISVTSFFLFQRCESLLSPFSAFIHNSLHTFHGVTCLTNKTPHYLCPPALPPSVDQGQDHRGTWWTKEESCETPDLLPLQRSESDQRRAFPSSSNLPFPVIMLPECSLPSPPLAFRAPCPTRAGPLWPAAVFTVNMDQC